MATPTNPDRKLSTFESLPLEIRRKVYDELLKADHIRQPPNGLMICHYKFETAILVVNKKIHSEAHNTLYYDNRFIVVSTNMDCFHACMEDHEVAAIACTKPKAVALFDVSRSHPIEGARLSITEPCAPTTRETLRCRISSEQGPQDLSPSRWGVRTLCSHDTHPDGVHGDDEFQVHLPCGEGVQ